MPLYEYQCDACDHRFEVIQKFSDAPVAACPRCEGAVHKLPSSPAIQFKGSGWYITDYARKGSNGGAGESGAKADGAGGSGDAAKGDGVKPDSSKKDTSSSPSTTTP